MKANKKEHYIMFNLYPHHYLEDIGVFKRCNNCGSTNLDEKIVDTVNSHVSEKEQSCKECGSKLGYWAYGYWESNIQDTWYGQFKLKSYENRCEDFIV